MNKDDEEKIRKYEEIEDLLHTYRYDLGNHPWGYLKDILEIINS